MFSSQKQLSKILQKVLIIFLTRINMPEFKSKYTIQDHGIRNKKTTLRFLKQAFQTELNDKKQNKKGQLEQMVSQMRIGKMIDQFSQKLFMNNIYQNPVRFELLSKDQQDKKRLILWKGFKLHKDILSVIFILQLLFLIITFVISSFMAFFDNFCQSDAHNSAIVISLNIVTAIFSLFKIVITSTSQKVKRGILLVYVTDICLDYVKSLIFFVDLIYLWIILALLMSRNNAQRIGFFLFVWSIIRITVSRQNLTLFRTNFINTFMKDQYLKLFKVIVFNFMFSHFVSTMLVAMTRIDRNQNWMVSMRIQDQLWYIQYMWSYYWATTIMMTVGFGDFLPVTYKQAFVITFLEFFSCVVLAYNISQIGAIISTIRSSQNQYISRIALFKRMAEHSQVSFELKMKIQSYLREQRQLKEKFQFTQQNQLLNTLPQPLKNQFIIESNKKLFTYLPFFKNLQRTTLVRLTEFSISKIYYPGQFLSKAHQNNCKIMILKQGKLGLSYRKQDSVMNGIIVQQIKIKESQIVTLQGQFSMDMTPVLLHTQFLSPQKQINFDLIAQTYSYVFQIDYQKFISIIRTSQIDAQYFFSMVHMHPSRLGLWSQLLCEFCSINSEQPESIQNKKKNKYKDESNHSYHNKFDCPKLHYFPLKGVIIYKYIRNPGKLQRRNTKFNRKQLKQKSCIFLHRNAFKIYEKTRFINERRNSQRKIEKQIGRSKCLGSFQKKQIMCKQQINKIRRTLLSQKPCELLDRYFQMNHRNNQFLKIQSYGQNEKSDKKSNNFVGSIDQRQLSRDQQQNERIVKEVKVIKQTMDQVVAENIQITFWDVQIDVMMNYFNYFPSHNAANFDNLQLVRGRNYQNRGFYVVTQIMRQNAHRRNKSKRHKQFKQLVGLWFKQLSLLRQAR